MRYNPEKTKEHKKVEKVVTGKIHRKKKSDAKKFAEVFISDDIHNVKSFVLMDVIVPTIKKTIDEIITNGTRMILYGDKVKSKGGSKVSYRDAGASNRDRYSSRRNRYDLDEIVLDSRGEAEEVLNTMFDLLEEYDVVTVSDYFELLGEDTSFVDEKYGWASLRSAEVVRVRNGYVIRLPKPMPID